MMKAVATTMMASALLAAACARGELELDRSAELQDQYTERKEDIDDCMVLFGDCLEVTEDNAAISDCAEALQVCLATAPEEGEDAEPDDENPFPGMEETGNDGDQPGPDEGDGESGELPGGDEDAQPDDDQNGDDGEPDAVGEICDPILQACLDDPSEFDPFCLDDFEECVEVEVALELQALCQDVQAQCLELDIPNFDCFELCS